MFSLNSGAQAVSFAAYGQGTGPILLDDVACTGTETRLIECRASPITTHNCIHTEDASVRCQAPPRKLGVGGGGAQDGGFSSPLPSNSLAQNRFDISLYHSTVIVSLVSASL